MKKPLLLLAIATLLSLSSYAQWSIGGSVGAVWDRPFLDENKYNNFFHYYSPIVQTNNVTVNNSTNKITSINYRIDLSILRQLITRWNVVSGLSFQQMGYIMEGKNGSVIKCNDWYVSLPLFIEFSFVKEQSYEVFVDAGMYGAYWCNSYYKYLAQSINGVYKGVEKKEFNKDVDNRFECGLICGVGYKYHFGAKWTCFAVVRYQCALTKQFKEPRFLDFLSRNNAFVFQLGLLYNL